MKVYVGRCKLKSLNFVIYKFQCKKKPADKILVLRQRSNVSRFVIIRQLPSYWSRRGTWTKPWRTSERTETGPIIGAERHVNHQKSFMVIYIMVIIKKIIICIIFVFRNCISLIFSALSLIAIKQYQCPS